MRQQPLWLLLRWSGRQSLFAPTTIVGAATLRERIPATATPTTTVRPMAACVAIEARCLALADGKFKNELLMAMSSTK
jgi:hypothetical protein